MGGTCSRGEPDQQGSFEGCEPLSRCRPNFRAKYKNCEVVGNGGEMVMLNGRVVCVVAAFNYEGYGALEKSGCTKLTSVMDGIRFGDLARSSGAQVEEYYDCAPAGSRCLGFPLKDRILQRIEDHAHALGPRDVFIFFYAGHGTQTADADGDEDDGLDEDLCFVKPDGSSDFLKDDEVAMLLQNFNPETHILFVTDCCHGGTICDLAREELSGRPIVHLSAVKDSQEADDIGNGGAFTCSLLETVEELVRQREEDVSVVEVFNACYGKYNGRQSDQDFKFERTGDFDPDCFRWPLMPPYGWEVSTSLDRTISALGRRFVE
eukprot:TRINITY_DN103632_c0_g1_i1.p1 TRINITY_DN103632_c0_g1~~TRINITY_DN103632_c0_g1_i1.p1  ORF type:complete len:320 (+),score=83.29 TRINITY_DN103632_c0_g1_i1:49-1008(+)